MDTKNRFLAIIPARGGSKGITNKNTTLLAGKKLIEWTIEASIQSSFISHVLVTSDDKHILNVASKYAVEVILRPDALATDTMKTEPVMSHALSSMEQNPNDFDYIVLLQPTSPLRNAQHIDDAISYLLAHQADSLISVCQPSHHPYKMFVVDGRYLKGVVNDDLPFSPRQEMPKAYRANGAIYIVDRTQFGLNEKLLTTKTLPFIMDEKSSIDIDTYEDLDRATQIMTKQDE